MISKFSNFITENTKYKGDFLAIFEKYPIQVNIHCQGDAFHHKNWFINLKEQLIPNKTKIVDFINNIENCNKSIRLLLGENYMLSFDYDKKSGAILSIKDHFLVISLKIKYIGK